MTLRSLGMVALFAVGIMCASCSTTCKSKAQCARKGARYKKKVTKQKTYDSDQYRHQF